MKISRIPAGAVLLVIASLLLASCGGAPTQAATEAPAVEKITASGFECPEPEPKMTLTSTELNLLVWTEYIPVEMLECFEIVYGVKVNRMEYSSNEDMIPILSDNPGVYDLVQPSDYVVQPMLRDALLQELDRSQLPNLKNIDPNYMNLEFDPGNRYTIPFQAGTDGIVANRDTVDPLPESWADLWKPGYAGRMVFLDDSRVIIGMTLLSLGYDVNSTDTGQLQEAKEKLAELIPNVQLFDSDTPSTVLISGDVDLGITWNGEAFTANQENPSVVYIFPVEGATIWQDNWAVPTGAPHLDAAYAWLNYSMQGNIFWMMLRDFPYTNPNIAALEYARQSEPELYTAYIQSPITDTPPEELKKGHRIRDIGDAVILYDQIWVELRGE